LFSGLTLLAAWIAGFGRVAYTVTMLVVAAALAYAVLDLVVAARGELCRSGQVVGTTGRYAGPGGTTTSMSPVSVS
jgi:hypothetical protein